jgi:ferredoxin
VHTLLVGPLPVDRAENIIYLRFKILASGMGAGAGFGRPGLTSVESEEAVMRVVVDHTRCTGLGICESLAPMFFEVDDNGELVLLKEDIADGELAAVEEAVRGCPTEALRIER